LVSASQIASAIARVFDTEAIPQSVASDLLEFHTALIEYVLHERQAARSFNVFGICGPQGIGKTTLTQVLQAVLRDIAGLSIAVLSVDDLYLSGAARERLASQVHPLLRTRGVPGTHNVARGIHVIKRLLEAPDDAQTPLPRFNKALDEPCSEQEEPLFSGRADLVILEGWCVGAMPQSADALIEPINELERDEDSHGVWRRYVNEQLLGPYRILYGLLDRLLLLHAQRFEDIYAWRLQQERKLAAKLRSSEVTRGASKVMSDAELVRFIMHYERLTQHILQEMPQRADVVVELDANRRVTDVYRPDGHSLHPAHAGGF
jgi:D-glycerate 3-kinase